MAPFRLHFIIASTASKRIDNPTHNLPLAGLSSFTTWPSMIPALVNCGIIKALLELLNHHNVFSFVIRAFRVINLVANWDMSVFEKHNGLNVFINLAANWIYELYITDLMCSLVDSNMSLKWYAG